VFFYNFCFSFYPVWGYSFVFLLSSHSHSQNNFNSSYQAPKADHFSFSFMKLTFDTIPQMRCVVVVRHWTSNWPAITNKRISEILPHSEFFNRPIFRACRRLARPPRASLGKSSLGISRDAMFTGYRQTTTSSYISHTLQTWHQEMLSVCSSY